MPPHSLCGDTYIVAHGHSPSFIYKQRGQSIPPEIAGTPASGVCFGCVRFPRNDVGRARPKNGGRQPGDRRRCASMKIDRSSSETTAIFVN